MYFQYSFLIIFWLCIIELNGWVVQSPRLRSEVANEVTGEEQEVSQQRMQFIFPGTKWCGSGNISTGYDDLGKFMETDKCCRAHDYCDDVIEAGGTKHNLTNHAFYTRLNCKCDEEFRNCLHDANSSSSNPVGIIYFDVLGTKCYKKDYPIKGCKERKNHRCVAYDLDKTGKPIWQWWDVPFY